MRSHQAILNLCAMLLSGWRATASPGQKSRRIFADTLKTLIDGF